MMRAAACLGPYLGNLFQVQIYVTVIERGHHAALEDCCLGTLVTGA